MVERILTPEHEAIVRELRETLAETLTVLGTLGAPEEDVARLRDALTGLDGLFLLVVAGEFNAGKSAVLNALLGRELLEEGVTPTTSKIHRLEYGETVERTPLGPAIERITLPAPLLGEVTIVDTPGTNALAREHEALTRDFIPRSDLVLFVTPATQPLSESERTFLEAIRDWGKRIAIVVNKVDLLEGRSEVEQVVAYVEENAGRLLGLRPPVLPLSARHGKRARAAGDEAMLEVSGLARLERFLVETLDSGERLRIKLSSPIGVAEHLLGAMAHEITSEETLLAEDLTVLDDIEGQITAWQEDVEREFGYRLGDIDSVLHAMEVRGHEFIDETFRLGRLPDLVRSKRIQKAFEEQVIRETPVAIQRKVDDLIDWLMESTVTQWQRVMEHVQGRAARHAGRIVGTVGGRFEANRSALLSTVGRAAQEAMTGYDRDLESRRMAEAVQQAVTGTALVEAGAVGLGTAVALIASSTAADVTGLAAAGVLATLGLFIIPARKARAKRELKEKIATTRRTLMEALTTEFRREAERNVARIRETIAPYSRFVRSESTRLAERRDTIRALLHRLATLRTGIEEAR